MRATSSTDATNAICGGLDALVEFDVAQLPDQCVRDELLALVRASRQLEAQIAARVAAFDARDLGPLDGCRDVQAFLKAFGRQPAHETTPMLKRGRFLRELPALAEASARGEVPGDLLRQVQELAKDIGAGKAAVLDDYLTTAVTQPSATPATVKDICDEVRAWLDPDGPEPDPEKDHEKRTLSIFRRDNNMHIRGLLDLEGGAALCAALDALMRPPTADDERTAGQRRADALGELALAALKRGDLPSVHGERPQLGILITPAGLARDEEGRPDVERMGAAFFEWMHRGAGPEGGGGGAGSEASDSAWLDWVGKIPAELARRIACDADVWRAILDPTTSLPLDVGRAYRVAPYWMRKVLHARDRGCRFTGCSAPTQWCDVHHMDHWVDGGRTKVERSLLLCRHHHRLVHEGGWAIDFDVAGEVRIYRPGGIPYELGANQSWAGPIRRRAG